MKSYYLNRNSTKIKVVEFKDVEDNRVLYWQANGKDLRPADVFSVTGSKVILFIGSENKKVDAMDCISFNSLRNVDFNMLKILDIVKEGQVEKRMFEIHDEMDWVDLVAIPNGFGWVYIMYTNNM